MTASPRGARLPGRMATSARSTRVQPVVRWSSTAQDSAGVLLHPASATTPAACAVASRAAAKPATKARPSAKSR